MEKRVNIRFKNEDTRLKVEELLRERNISFNQFINDLLDDYFLNNEDKRYLKNISDNLDSHDTRLKNIEDIQSNMALVISRCLSLLLIENTKNVFELEDDRFNPDDYYHNISDYSLNLLLDNTELIRGLANYISSYTNGGNKDE